jgi:hypothetical protein
MVAVYQEQVRTSHLDCGLSTFGPGSLVMIFEGAREHLL